MVYVIAAASEQPASGFGHLLSIQQEMAIIASLCLERYALAAFTCLSIELGLHMHIMPQRLRACC